MSNIVSQSLCHEENISAYLYFLPLDAWEQVNTPHILPFTNHRNEANNYPLFTFLNWIQSNWVWYNCILKISLASIDFPCNWIIFLITFIFSQDWNILSSTADFLEDLVFNFISPSPYVIQPQLRFAWNNYVLKILPSRIICWISFIATILHFGCNNYLLKLSQLNCGFDEH